LSFALTFSSRFTILSMSTASTFAVYSACACACASLLACSSSAALLLSWSSLLCCSSAACIAFSLAAAAALADSAVATVLAGLFQGLEGTAVLPPQAGALGLGALDSDSPAPIMDMRSLEALLVASAEGSRVEAGWELPPLKSSKTSTSLPDPETREERNFAMGLASTWGRKRWSERGRGEGCG
jgi:hypothetical protein